MGIAKDVSSETSVGLSVCLSGDPWQNDWSSYCLGWCNDGIKKLLI